MQPHSLEPRKSDMSHTCSAAQPDLQLISALQLSMQGVAAPLAFLFEAALAKMAQRPGIAKTAWN